MKWEEFKALLTGIAPNTPLGRVVYIRSETDSERIKDFTSDQHKIRNDWLTRRAAKRTEIENLDALESLKKAFITLAGTR